MRRLSGAGGAEGWRGMQGDSFTHADRMRVRRAFAAFETERTRVADALRRGPGARGARIVGVGDDAFGRFTDSAAGHRRVDVMRSPGHWDLESELARYSRLAAEGVVVRCTWDAGVPEAVRLRLGLTEAALGHRFGIVPADVWIFGERLLLLDGPYVRGRRSAMVVTDPASVRAGIRYRDAVDASSHPCSVAVDALDGLSDRQRRIAVLLTMVRDDHSIAAKEGVSVRTVRSDIAVILAHCGAVSRFSAGVRLADSLKAGARGWLDQNSTSA